MEPYLSMVRHNAWANGRLSPLLTGLPSAELEAPVVGHDLDGRAGGRDVPARVPPGILVSRGEVNSAMAVQVAQQVLGAELVADPVEGVVVDVPVVHDDGAVQVAVDELPEGGQVPAAEEVVSQQVGARDLEVLLAGLRARPGAQRGLIAADDPGPG